MPTSCGQLSCSSEPGVVPGRPNVTTRPINNRYRGVENRDDKSRDEEGGNQAARLSRIIPVKNAASPAGGGASGGEARVGSNRLSKKPGRRA